jgi:hypothetical protein
MADTGHLPISGCEPAPPGAFTEGAATTFECSSYACVTGLRRFTVRLDERRERMPVLKRELAFDAERPLAATGDWWQLVLDTEAPGLYIEHTWTYTSPHSTNKADSGAQRFGINDFLTLAEGQVARPALMTALSEMFRDAKPN